MTAAPAAGEIEALVGPDRAHRRVYTDPALFEREMERIFGRLWIFVGHDSQVPNPGDWTRTRIGREDAVMVRHDDGGVRVLLNRCAHRGMAVCMGRSGSARRLVCPYHGWAYGTDGRLLGAPHPKGYDDGARGRPGMPPAARVAAHRGFVFASLAGTGPTLAEYLGEIADALDNMADRSPEGRLRLDGGCLRQTFRGNWKLHMENAVDMIHPGFVHESSVAAARAHMEEAGEDKAEADQAVLMFRANGLTPEEWDRIGIHAYPEGHVFMGGFYRGGAIDPDRRDGPFRRYREAMAEAYGEDGAARILGRETFNNLVYPNLSLNTRFQQIRVVHPVAVDRTDVHSYVFRLEGAPEEMFHAAVKFVSTANSPASPVLADDLAVFERLQTGLAGAGGEWIDLSRRAGRDEAFGARGRRDAGTSELALRAMLGAWRRHMAA